MRHLQNLNERQREAAAHLEGPLLIIAGAGAGKTKTITHRIAHLIELGTPARSILAVTFTNKAAGEMRERIRELLTPSDPNREEHARDLPVGRQGAGMPLVATFHSLGVRVLREFHEDAGLSRNFTIWDRDDSVRAVKQSLDGLGIAQWPPRAILSTISRKKGDGVTVREFAESAKNFRERSVASVWERYEKALSDEGALDFDDLLARTLILLRSSERVRGILQNRWTHVTIDEYQDTNRAQYEIARLLAGERKNICVVGDIDQNIYSWRGADIEHLLSFEESFAGAKVVTLEQNYRSTRTILAAANAVIEKNTRRRPKNLYTDNPTGEPIEIYGAQNELDEAWFVAQKAAALIESGVRAGDIAVLYRENFQSRALEEAMLALSVPYRVIGVRFFERKEVKDTLSYLRAALNTKSKVDLSRIAGVPARGIGKVTLERMLAGDDSALSPSARAKVGAFRECLSKISHAVGVLPASEAIRFASEVSGMEAMYKETEEGRERLENIHELVNLAVRYDHEEPPLGIEKLLEEAALQSDQDELDEKIDAVALMTVHASKGLEFDVVFVTGLEQGLFPWVRDEDSERDSEEERRLFYVALTRARRTLILTHARERMKYGSREYTVPSEFLEDIDPRLTRAVARKRSLIGDDEETIRY
ncbi:MAG TPA: UvrD-helicase domain-containing protein [Candidatus Paceibacterota bacterium]